MAPVVTMTGPKTPHGKEQSVVDVLQNIKVFVRCRPLKANEKKNVIEVISDRKEVRINESKNSNERYNSKTFTFDNAFNADTSQLHIYKCVVEPLIQQVVMGYNCTVFAYGQTGTGKTYTMEGERSLEDNVCSWADDPLAGIIPRALHQLFETLADEKCEYTVRVSFLELYNEELYDLLSSIDDTTKLKIYEDSTRKGSIIVDGLEDITVHSKAEIYDILRKGSAKRQTAATLMNACSSRSHTIFSVTVHIKESAIDGEDLVKIGKLNLVDLAGSENIGRSGAIDKRAREAGNINQSLLTLGRVITSLVDRCPHIPYRESKLTRLLQESLGGRTKTSIIATISPNIADADDTLSTLEYAQRAKKITNKPEINQKMSKKTLLREYTAEIERLRRDLTAARDKNGIYVDEENFLQMEQQIKCQQQDIEEKISQINALEEEMNKIQELFGDTKNELNIKVEELEITNKNLMKTSQQLNETKGNLRQTRRDRDEQKHLVEVHVNSEKLLTTQAKQLLDVTEQTTCDVNKLHNKVDRQKTVETKNFSKANEFQAKFLDDMNLLEELVSITTTSYNDSLEEMLTSINEKTNTAQDIVTDTHSKVTALTNSMTEHKSRLSSIFLKDRITLEQVIGLKDTNFNLKELSIQSFDAILRDVMKHQSNISEDIDKLNEIFANQRQKVEDVLMKQNSHLKSISKITIDSFNRMKVDLKSVFESLNNEMNSIVSQMESSNDENIKSHEQLDKDFEEMEKLINSQMQTMKEIQIKRIAARLKSTESVSDLKNKMTETSKNQWNSLQEINNKVDVFVSEINCEESVGLKYIESIDNLNTINTQEIMDKTSEMSVKNTEIPNQIQELINNDKQKIIKTGTVMDQLIGDTIVSTDKQLTAKETLLRAMSEKLNEGLDEQNNGLLSITDNIKNISECVSDKISEMCRMSQTMEKSQIREIENRNRTFEAFFKNDLVKDVPTGTTPQKTEYSYPRDLTQTSPHERILERFRLINADNTSFVEESESEVVSDANNSNTSSKSFDSNDENVKPLNTSNQSKSSKVSKNRSNSSLKAKSDTNQTFILDNDFSKKNATPKPLSVNRNN
ncbi:kinesin-like protein KIF11 [Oppia nitens]|uniref:kinesin-like protein KIF11 n=1 Tax=Oppia nitens TaxID=1686743 RepID=UPI0023DA0C78|nr:kinesin-like protein KIF11 [Oppia nitens]